MIKDKIFVDSKRKTIDRFEKNPIPEISHLSVDYYSLKHTEELEYNRSYFQGHKISVNNTDQVVAARNAIFANPRTADADHVIYAYKITNEDDQDQTGYRADREYTAGKIVMNYIEQSELTNIFICVTRKKTGGNIGPAQFTMIKQTAQEALKLPNSVQNVNVLYKDLRVEK